MGAAGTGALRPPALAYHNPSAWTYRLRSWLFLLATLGVGAAIAGMVTDTLRVTDGPLTMFVTFALVVAGTVHAEMGRRRFPERLWEVPDGLVIETPGLLRPARRFVPTARAALAHVSPADPRGLSRGMIAVRMPGEPLPYLFDPRRGAIPFGSARAETRRKPRRGPR